MIAYHFWAPNCGDCTSMKPLFAELKEDFPQFEWKDINVRTDKSDLIQKYGITAIPALVVQTDTQVQKTSGTNQIEYYRILRDSV